MLLLFAASPTFGGDWETGVGGSASRAGLSTDVGPLSANILWQGSLPAIVAGQAVIGQDLVIVTRITSFTIPTGTTIVAHDRLTGDIVWTAQLPFNFPDSWRSRVSAIRDNQVYATRSGNTAADFLYALDPADGEILWESEDVIVESSTESPSFADNGDLIVGSFGSLMRIDRTDGSTVWSVPRSCPTTDGCAPAVFGDRAYIWEASGSGPKVTVFDVEDGAALYSSDGIGGGIIQQVGLFVGPDGTVYAPRTQNNPMTDFFTALEDTGEALVEKWSVPMGYVPFASFAVGPDATVYTYAPDNQIIRLDPKDGEVIDSSGPIPFDFPMIPRMAIDAHGKVFVTNGGFPSGRLLAFDADLALRWSSPITNVNIGGPAIGDGGVLVVCGIGTDVRAYQTVLGDDDGDGAVDLDDLVGFTECMTGPTGDDLGGDCEIFDFDNDDDVDLRDFGAFGGNFGGG
ncbi:MAG: PQQ-like beta-propeller repeat protein [Planctomycetes bacterium]|nr:PQQ-like beta-propeller repeat protein [Planctomycetota bacterium]